MKKRLLIFLLVLLGTLIFSNALKFVPKDYEYMLYIPDISRIYEEVKKTNTGDIFANQIGLEPMLKGVIEQQLMVQNYTLEDLDIFKEFLVAGKKDDVVIVVGPSEDPDKIKDIFEKFTGQVFPEEVKVEDGYFIFGENYGGGSLPQQLLEYLTKDYLAVSYMNAYDEEYEVKGYGYVEAKNNTISFYQEIVPQNDAARELINELSKQKGKDILDDSNIGGDVFGFINRKIPDFIMELISSAATSVANVDILNNFEGTAYVSADISSFIISAMSGEPVNSIPSYGVVYYNSPTWNLIEDIDTYKTINGEKYGVVTTDEGTPVLYVKLENDKMVFYGISPDEYTPGSRDFIESNYKDTYMMGLFINLKPTIFNFVGIETEAYLKFYSYIEDGKIIQKSILK
ncbi:MAG: hypothetical protein H0Z24_05080 [Thermosipho sp. (in: Bacteria)]|nr:hypothetical protein [Thermosipho sp. (in: thermotogales)]